MTLCLHYMFLTFFNTARESDKSYMINHVVYFALTIHKSLYLQL